MQEAFREWGGGGGGGGGTTQAMLAQSYCNNIAKLTGRWERLVSLYSFPPSLNLSSALSYSQCLILLPFLRECVPGGHEAALGLQQVSQPHTSQFIAAVDLKGLCGKKTYDI